MRRLILTVWVTSIVTSLVAPSLGAAILVTRAGERIETDGPWKIDGQRVVYRLPSGALTAIRLEEVDLEATKAAALRREEPKRREEPEITQATPDTADPILILRNGSTKGSVGMSPAHSPEHQTLDPYKKRTLAERLQTLGQPLAGKVAKSLATIDAEHNLASTRGIQDAAADLEAVADTLRQYAPRNNPRARLLAYETAKLIDEVARLAWENPRQAIDRFRAITEGS